MISTLGNTTSWSRPWTTQQPTMWTDSSLIPRPSTIRRLESRAHVDAYSPSDTQKVRRLLSIGGLGDQRPTQLLRYMKTLHEDAPETRYSTFDPELPAVYLAVRHFRHFVEGRPLHLYTDHKPLTFAMASNTDFSPRQTSSFLRHFFVVTFNLWDKITLYYSSYHLEE
jgi:hypothetical protein